MEFRLIARTAAVAAVAVAALSAPRAAAAQMCATADALAGICLIDPSAAEGTPTPANFGVPVNSWVRVYAKSVGGLSYFSGSLYAFASAPDPFDPLATQNVFLGGKGNGGLLTLANPWIELPWAVRGGDALYFGLLADVVLDFSQPTVTTPYWLISGYGTSAVPRYDQAGRTSSVFSYVFPAVGPVGDQMDINDPQSTREPTPAQWYASAIGTPNGAGAGSRTFLVGFEDNPFWSDGDFNDAVLAVNVSAVPEPATFALLAGGLAVLGVAARRRRR